MTNKPTCEELEQRNKELAQEVDRLKQEQEKGRKNEAFLSYAIDSLPYPFLLIDTENYSIVMANAVARQYCSDEKKTCYALTHNSDAPCKDPEHICPLLEVKRTGKPATVEHIHYDKDGGPRTVTVHAFPVFDENKRIVQIIEYSTDITEQKDTMERLQKIERLMNTSQGLTIVGGWEWDIKNQSMFWTEELYRIYGFQPGDLTPDTAEIISRGIECYDPEDRPVVIEAFWNCVQKGQSYNLEFPFTTTTGRRIWIRTISEAVMEGDRVVKVVGSLMDITESKQTEEELQESEEKYRFIANNVSDFIWTLNLEMNKFGFISPSVEILLGYSTKEYQAMTLQDTLPPESLESVKEIISRELEIDGKKGIDPNRNKTFELEQIRKDGARIWTEVRASFIRDVSGKPESIIGVTRDITERKKAEEDKARLEEQLRQVHKMEAIGTLAGGFAHNFNNILGIILGNIELSMNDVPEWSPARHNLKEINKAGLRARDMVRQILSFSRQTEQTAKPIRLSQIIEESLKLIRSSIPEAIEIRQTFSALQDTIQADPTQINQILMNLCTNANHAMGKKGGILEVGLKNMAIDEEDAVRYHDLTAGKYIVLTVSDTGHGIEQNIVGRIFDPYFTTKDVSADMGMGLSVVHGIIKNYMGAIHVYSEPGKGTTFKVFFPLIES